MPAGIGSLGSLGSLRVNLAMSTKDFDKDIKNADNSLGKFETATDKRMKKINLAMVGIGVATVTGVALAVKHFGDFELSMKNVQAVSGATAEEFETLKEFAIDMGSTTQFTAREAGDAMYFLASAGLAVKEQMETTSAVLDLASATQTGLAESAQIVVNTMSGFSLEADQSRRIADVFAESISTSQANMSKLGVAMPVVSATMDDLGISLETTVTGLSLLFDKGGRAETAATGLRNAMKRLIEPSDEAADEIERLQLTVGELDPRVNSLVDIIGKLEKAGFDTAASIKIFGLENDAMNKLVSTGAEKFAEFEKNMRNAAGAAQEMKDVQLDSLAGDITLLKSAVDGAIITFGGTFSTTVRNAASSLTDMVTQWNNLGDTTKSTIAWTTALGGAGVGLIGGLGLLGLQIPKLLTGLGSLAGIVAVGGKLALGIGAGAALWWAYQRVVKALKEPVDQLANSLKALTIVDKGTNKAIGTLKDALNRLEKEGINTTDASIAHLGISYKDLNKELNSGLGTWDRLAQIVTGTGKNVELMITPQTNVANLLKVLEERAGKAADKMEDLKDKIKGVGDESKETAPKIDDVTTATDGAKKATDDFLEVIKLTPASLVAEQVALLDLAKIMDDTRENMLNAFNEDVERAARWGIRIGDIVDSTGATASEKGNFWTKKILDDKKTANVVLSNEERVAQDGRAAFNEKFHAGEVEKEREAEDLKLKIIDNAARARKVIVETSWLDTVNTVNAGVGLVSNSYFRLRDVFHDVNNATNEFHDTWLSSMADWIDNVAVLLNNLTTLWANAVSIISKVASFIPGGDGGGAAGLVTGAATGGGGIGALGATIGGGIATGAGAAFGAIAPALPLLGPVAAFVGAALLINKFNKPPGSANERTEEERRRDRQAATNRRIREENAQIRRDQVAANNALADRLKIASQQAATGTLARLTGGVNFEAGLFVGSNPLAVSGGAGFAGGTSGGAGVDRIVTKLDQILQAMTSGASSGSALTSARTAATQDFQTWEAANRAAEGLGAEMHTVSGSMIDVTGEAFRLSDELAGHSLTTAMALSTDEAKKMSAALTIVSKELTNAKKQVDLVTLAEKNRAALLSSSLTSQKKRVAITGDVATQRRQDAAASQEIRDRANQMRAAQIAVGGVQVNTAKAKKGLKYALRRGNIFAADELRNIAKEEAAVAKIVLATQNQTVKLKLASEKQAFGFNLATEKQTAALSINAEKARFVNKKSVAQTASTLALMRTRNASASLTWEKTQGQAELNARLQTQGIEQNNTSISLLRDILKVLESGQTATPGSRQDIGSALWEIIAPSARLSGAI